MSFATYILLILSKRARQQVFPATVGFDRWSRTPHQHNADVHDAYICMHKPINLTKKHMHHDEHNNCGQELHVCCKAGRRAHDDKAKRCSQSHGGLWILDCHPVFRFDQVLMPFKFAPGNVWDLHTLQSIPISTISLLGITRYWQKECGATVARASKGLPSVSKK
jgi:hypothetical protein